MSIGVRAGLLFLLLVAGLARGADLTAELVPLATQPRPGAPMWMNVRLQSKAAALHEGALEFVVKSGGETLYRYRTQELAVAGGSQQFRFLLPTASLAYGGNEYSCTLRFIERERVIELGEFPSAPRFNGNRPLLIGAVRDFGTSGSGGFAAWQALRLERFAPAPDDKQGGSIGYSTTPVFLAADDLPTDPLGYCAFDAFLLEGRALLNLREKPRAALAAWVRAGGRLALLGPTGLQPGDVDWLNGLVTRDPGVSSVSLDASGRLSLPPKVARADFGRVLLSANSPDEQAANTAAWRVATASFWNVRQALCERLATSERWKAGDSDFRRFDRGRGARITEHVGEMLMPRTVRTIPYLVLWSVLGGFVLLIGPVDWLVLGWFRRRRWTWIVFPCVVALTTFGTLALARGYIGGAGQTGTLIITDLGTDGRVVRETRIAFALPASEGEISTERRTALSAPFPINLSGQYYPDRRSVAPITFAGQYPAHFTLTQPTRQWAPLFTRLTSLAPAVDGSGIKWPANKSRLAFSNDVAALIDEHQVDTRIDLAAIWSGNRRFTESQGVDYEWLKSATSADGAERSALFSQQAPTGSSSLDDLFCREGDSTTESVLVASRREGSDIHIWRRLYLH